MVFNSGLDNLVLSFNNMIVQVVLIVSVIAQSAYGREPSRIIGGQEAARSEFPHQVSLRIYDEHICGGTIISNWHILTAAHCIVGVVEPPYSEMTVVTGINSLRSQAGAKAYLVKDVKVHAGYVPQTKNRAVRNDIAVITVRKKIEKSEFQKLINLPNENTPSRVVATVSGWGRTSANSKLSAILQKAQVSILSAEDCFANGVRVVSSQICGFSGSAVGTCNGDSGGPLIYNNAVVGIVSTSGPCGQGYPDIYTRVYSYLDFIKSIINQSSV